MHRRLILTWRLWRCRPLHYRWLPAWRAARLIQE